MFEMFQIVDHVVDSSPFISTALNNEFSKLFWAFIVW